MPVLLPYDSSKQLFPNMRPGRIGKYQNESPRHLKLETSCRWVARALVWEYWHTCQHVARKKFVWKLGSDRHRSRIYCAAQALIGCARRTTSDGVPAFTTTNN